MIKTLMNIAISGGGYRYAVDLAIDGLYRVYFTHQENIEECPKEIDWFPFSYTDQGYKTIEEVYDYFVEKCIRRIGRETLHILSAHVQDLLDTKDNQQKKEEDTKNRLAEEGQIYWSSIEEKAKKLKLKKSLVSFMFYDKDEETMQSRYAMVIGNFAITKEEDTKRQGRKVHVYRVTHTSTGRYLREFTTQSEAKQYVVALEASGTNTLFTNTDLREKNERYKKAHAWFRAVNNAFPERLLPVLAGEV